MLETSIITAIIVSFNCTFFNYCRYNKNPFLEGFNHFLNRFNQFKKCRRQQQLKKLKRSIREVKRVFFFFSN